jgi:cation/acetate symporter
VSASFSLAASAFVPAMLLGILWRGANRQGAAAGMLAGLGVTVYYMLVNAPAYRAFWQLAPGQQLWFGIQPLSAAVFGVPVGLVVTWLVSLLARGRS